MAHICGFRSSASMAPCWAPGLQTTASVMLLRNALTRRCGLPCSQFTRIAVSIPGPPNVEANKAKPVPSSSWVPPRAPYKPFLNSRPHAHRCVSYGTPVWEAKNGSAPLTVKDLLPCLDSHWARFQPPHSQASSVASGRAPAPPPTIAHVLH